jgi:hypothetical protein
MWLSWAREDDWGGRVSLPFAQPFFVMPRASAFSFEFSSERPPADAIASLLPLVPEFAKSGYNLEAQTGDTLVLAHRFTPTPAYAVPLVIAAVAFVIGITSSNPHAATNGGRAAGILVLVAIFLSIFVKTTERVTFSARNRGSGCRVAVTGTAPPRFRDYPVTIAGEFEEHRSLAVLRDAVRHEAQEAQEAKEGTVGEGR